jgi:hypothetical protein
MEQPMNTFRVDSELGISREIYGAASRTNRELRDVIATLERELKHSDERNRKLEQRFDRVWWVAFTAIGWAVGMTAAFLGSCQ